MDLIRIRFVHVRFVQGIPCDFLFKFLIFYLQEDAKWIGIGTSLNPLSMTPCDITLVVTFENPRNS
jgi:hypothetical protein